jgi:hypothetical protein
MAGTAQGNWDRLDSANLLLFSEAMRGRKPS